MDKEGKNLYIHISLELGHIGNKLYILLDTMNDKREVITIEAYSGGTGNEEINLSDRRRNIILIYYLIIIIIEVH